MASSSLACLARARGSAFLGAAPQESHAQGLNFLILFNPLLLILLGGNVEGSRLVMATAINGRQSGAFVTQAVSYDQNFRDIHGGLGLVVMNDQAGQNIDHNDLIYSYAKTSQEVLSAHGAGSDYFRKHWTGTT